MKKELDDSRSNLPISGEDIHLVEFLLDLGISLSSERHLDRLLEKIIDESLDITNSDGCTLYLVDDDGNLCFTISKTTSLGVSLGGLSGAHASFPPVPMDPAFVSAYAAINKKIVNIPDVYKSSEFDFTGPRKYDELNGYRSVSMLVAPLANQEGKVIGVLQLLNAMDTSTGEVIPYSGKYEIMVHSLASFAAVAVTNVRMEQEIEQKAAMLKEANMDAIFSLAVAAEQKDDDTGQHVRRIQMYSTALAKEVGISDEVADEIGYSSIMHDVGKISVPDYVLKKPGKLTDEEFSIMKDHTKNGSKILPDKPFFKIARQIARHHHEKWNGKGYPDGLAGEQIPINARIVAVVDVFDALTSKRVYKKAWTCQDAMSEITKCAGTAFDPELALAWKNLCHTGPLRDVVRQNLD